MFVPIRTVTIPLPRATAGQRRPLGPGAGELFKLPCFVVEGCGGGASNFYEI